MTKFIVIIALLAAFHTVAHPLSYKLYEGIYIVIENDNNMLRIDDVVINTKELTPDLLREISSLYNSKKFLLGLETGFKVGNMLDIIPLISEIDAEIFTYSKKMKRINKITIGSKSSNENQRD